IASSLLTTAASYLLPIVRLATLYFSFSATSPIAPCTLSLHDALPIYAREVDAPDRRGRGLDPGRRAVRGTDGPGRGPPADGAAACRGRRGDDRAGVAVVAALDRRLPHLRAGR